MSSEDNEVFYKKSYNMNVVGDSGYTVTVAIPPEVIRREAERRNLTVPEFIEQYNAIAQYDGIESVLYTFKEKE